MENNEDKRNSPQYDNPNDPKPNDAPPDPSHTNQIGQKVEQGVVSKREGISEQSAEWEDAQESKEEGNIISEKAEKYLKDPSPEEATPNNESEEE